MKKIIASLLTITALSSMFAFDWPKDNVTSDSYSSYFGQKHGEVLSTSLIFNEEGDVRTAEEGRLLIIMTDEDEDSDFFPSTLGSSVIIAHNDNLMSVYGNLDTDSITYEQKKAPSGTVKAKTQIGKSGKSGWIEGNGTLEFQIIDTNNNTAINPKILMPRSKTEIPLVLSGIQLQNKSGKFFDINKTKTYENGLYRVFMKRNDVASPYKTSVAINGITVDQITYDTISQENGKSCVSGKKKYTSKDIYPMDDLQLLGEIKLTPGKATLTLYAEDILGKSKQLNYYISIY